jgi:hypothetical protein
MNFNLESNENRKQKKSKVKADQDEFEEKIGYITWKNKTKVPIEFIDKM